MISVIVPNYNHAPYLKKRIDSILTQTYQDFELIILDDCSTDNSRDIIDAYRNHPKVSQIIYNELNSGSTFKQWRKGVSLARGEYIWIAESDDIADYSLLNTLYDNITKEDEVVLSYCQSYKMDASGNLTGTWKEQVQYLSEGDTFFSGNFIANGIDFIDRFLLYKNVIPNASAVLFKKDAYNEVGGVNLDVKACADWLLWLKIATVGKIAFSPLLLNYFRYHKKSVIATVTNNDKLFLKGNFDIVARKRYDAFLISYKYPIIVDKNISLIEKEYILDVFECYNNNAYYQMIVIFYKAFRNSKNKRNLISKLIKYLIR